MSLRQKQSHFAHLFCKLVLWIFSHPGWEITFGEGYDDDGRGHMVGSLHYLRLAFDINLFVHGVWITEDHPVWQEIGRYWKSLDGLCRWGGDFESGDFNHFSLEHNGRA